MRRAIQPGASIIGRFPHQPEIILPIETFIFTDEPIWSLIAPICTCQQGTDIGSPLLDNAHARL
jgi:hypothetical protein